MSDLFPEDPWATPAVAPDPWAFDPVTGAAYENEPTPADPQGPGTAVATPGLGLFGLDLLDGDAWQDAVHTLHTGLADALEARAAELAQARPDGPLTATGVASEVRFLADAAERLAAVAGVFTTEAKRATAWAGEVAQEVAPRDVTRGGSTSINVGVPGADRHLHVSVAQPTALSVDDAKVLDLVVAAITHQVPDDQAPAAADGARRALEVVTSLAKPTWRVSALDGYATQLEQANLPELADRLRRAYGRKPTGSPKVTIESREGAPARTRSL